MAEAVEEFELWLGRFSVAIRQTAQVHSNLESLHARALMDSVPLADIESNHSRRKELAASNSFARHDAEIAKLDKQHEEYWGKDVDVMREYEQRVYDELRKLPSWEEPPSEKAHLTMGGPVPDTGLLSFEFD